MSENQSPSPEKKWICGKCGSELETMTVNLNYLGAGIPVDLLVCKKCNRPLIPADMALGKMLEVEKLLEDK